MATIGMIQMTSGPDPWANISFIDVQLKALAKQGAKLVLTPENALLFGKRDDYLNHAELLGQGPLQEALAKLAKNYKLWLVVGSFPIFNGERLTSTSLVFNHEGTLVSHYDKLHMFDVDVDDKHGRYRESETFTPGEEIVTLESPVGRLGLTICYDLRFPQLFSRLREQGAQIICVPSAFTVTTGQAHWELLLRARAIETQCWIVAAAQTGQHPCGRETWGHSMLIDPWGRIEGSIGHQVGACIGHVDHTITTAVRTNMPIHSHTRFDSQLK